MAEEIQQKTFKVEGMMCHHCEAHVKEALAARFEIEAPAPEPEEKTVEVEKIVEVTVPDTEIAAKLQELRETIIDLEDADGKLSQARTARFISRYMDVLGI